MKTRLLIALLLLLQAGFLAFYLFNAPEPYARMKLAIEGLRGENVFIGSNEAKINAETSGMISAVMAGYRHLVLITILFEVSALAVSTCLMVCVLRKNIPPENPATAPF